MITKPPMPPWLRLIGRDNGKGGVAGGMQWSGGRAAPTDAGEGGEGGSCTATAVRDSWRGTSWGGASCPFIGPGGHGRCRLAALGAVVYEATDMKKVKMDCWFNVLFTCLLMAPVSLEGCFVIGRRGLTSLSRRLYPQYNNNTQFTLWKKKQ
jgi:hypothetical protein